MSSIPVRRWLLSLLLVLPVLAAADEQTCFGAVGQQCGSFNNRRLQGIAFCLPPPPMSSGICAVSGGSWAHDQCCFDHADGVMCGGSGSQRCASEWDQAVNRFLWGYQWFRSVDYRLVDRDGNVDRPLYCAKPGAGLHRRDRQYCCAGASHRASFWDRLARPSLYRCDG